MRHGWRTNGTAAAALAALTAGGTAAAALAALAAGGTAAAAEAPGPLFASAEPLILAIRAPIASLGAKAVAGTLTVAGTEALPITLTTRGITRRNSDICSFPPLAVAFTTPPAAASPFSGQSKLKLVTHCRADDGFRHILLLEYAAYRMYNLLTPTSYGVRLAQIDYQDARGKRVISRLGFFIEDVKDVGRRNDLKRLKTTERVNPARLAPREAARYALFEAMIGNLDWSMVAGPAGSECCHNSKLLGQRGGATGPLVPLPYDFDFAGMVDAPYATPPAGVRVANVRERRYRGYCRHNAEARALAVELTGRRSEMLAMLDQVPQLSGPARGKAKSYLGGFFDQIATPGGVDKLLATCVS